MLTQLRLKELIHYDPKTGIFRWLIHRCGPRTRGRRAGTIKGSKYRVISVDRRRYPASRLAYLYMTGVFPPDDRLLDHRNQDKFDDRWGNLRLATHAQNVINTGPRANNKSGLKGVSFDRKRNRWRAQIRRGGVQRVTVHKTAEEAAASYDRMSQELDGDFAANRQSTQNSILDLYKVVTE